MDGLLLEQLAAVLPDFVRAIASLPAVVLGLTVSSRATEAAAQELSEAARQFSAAANQAAQHKPEASKEQGPRDRSAEPLTVNFPPDVVTALQHVPASTTSLATTARVFETSAGTIRDASSEFNEGAKALGDMFRLAQQHHDSRAGVDIVDARGGGHGGGLERWGRGAWNQAQKALGSGETKSLAVADGAGGMGKAGLALLTAQTADLALAGAGEAAGAAAAGTGRLAAAMAGLASTLPGIGLAVGGTVVALGALAAGVYKSATAAESHSRELLNAQRALARVSPEIAMVFAHDNLREIQRQRASGSATGASTGLLANTTNDLSDALRPIKDFGTNVNNVMQSGINTIMTKILEPFGSVFEKMNEWLGDIADNTNPNRNKAMSMIDYLEARAKQHEKDRQHNRDEGLDENGNPLIRFA